MSKDKEYGLIIPKKATSKKQSVASAFADDSSEDEESKAIVSGGTDWMKRKLASGMSQNAKSGATGKGTKIKAQTKLELQKAVEEDPTVFQYDEVYDQMEASKVEEVSKKKDKDRKPRYIANLLKQAEIRNKDNERRIERQVQKEREAEGDEFADKEKFVTSAYRKKMEEMQKLDEEDRRRDAIETMLDVTKQKDMSGFYRHFYRQTMGEEKGQSVKEEPEIKMEETDDNEAVVQPDKLSVSKKTKPSKRTYRQRDDEHDHDDDTVSSHATKASKSSSEDEEMDEAEATKESEESRIEKDKRRRDQLKRQKDKRERRKRRIEEGRDTSSEEEEEEDSGEDEPSKDSVSERLTTDLSSNETNKENLPKKSKELKCDIWKKVTVGDIFEAALQRYLIRKAERGSRFPW